MKIMMTMTMMTICTINVKKLLAFQHKKLRIGHIHKIINQSELNGVGIAVKNYVMGNEFLKRGYDEIRVHVAVRKNDNIDRSNEFVTPDTHWRIGTFIYTL